MQLIGFIILAMLCVVSFCRTVVAKGPTVMSIGQCVDQYVMELADPDQILSLSNRSWIPSVSFYADYAKEHNFKQNSGTAEEVLAFQPDVVFADVSSGPTPAMLRVLHVDVDVMRPPNNIRDVIKHIRHVAAALDQVARGDIIINQIETAISELSINLKTRPLALFYTYGGYTQGKNSYFEGLAVNAGYRNAPTEAGLGKMAVMGLERTVMLQPDVMFEGFAANQLTNSTSLINHPAFRRAVPDMRRVRLPFQIWFCGGSGKATVDALKFLQQARVDVMDNLR